MGMTNEQLLQSITTVIVDRFDMLDGRIERLEQRVDKMDTETSIIIIHIKLLRNI